MLVLSCNRGRTQIKREFSAIARRNACVALQSRIAMRVLSCNRGRTQIKRKFIVIARCNACVALQLLAYEPLPNRFAYIMERGCRNRGHTPLHVAGKLFATKQVHIKHDRLQLAGASFWWSAIFHSKKSKNHLNEIQKIRDLLLLEKNNPAKNAPHRSPELGWSP